jgi:hypothetical protein
VIDGTPESSGNPRSPYFRQFNPQLQQTLARLNDANVSVYPIDVRGLPVDSRSIVNIGAMRQMANATGGKAFYNRNDLATGVRAALDDSREVYVLTYSPQPFAADGAYHRIRVQTSRRGVQLRYRLGYYAPGKEETPAAPAAGRLPDVVSSPRDASDVGIQATLQETAGQVALVILVDPADLDLVPNAARWAGAIHLEAMQLGAAGERLGGVSQTAEINLEQATYQRVLQEGLSFAMKFQREPSAVAVRIGVVDEHGGHAGSVSVPLTPNRAATGKER